MVFPVVKFDRPKPAELLELVQFDRPNSPELLELVKFARPKPPELLALVACDRSLGITKERKCEQNGEQMWNIVFLTLTLEK